MCYMMYTYKYCITSMVGVGRQYSQNVYCTEFVNPKNCL